jgi:hypothetical protein
MNDDGIKCISIIIQLSGGETLADSNDAEVQVSSATTTTQQFIGLTAATLKLHLKSFYHPEGTLNTPWVS